MYATVKTIYYTQLELLRALNKPFAAIEYSTLNEKFNVKPGEELPDSVYPELKYIAIGRGGHRGRISADGSTLIDVVQHNVKHAALYQHLPFILREVGEDLNTQERSKYAMRALIESDGIKYFAYYLKKITYDSTYPEIKEMTILDGNLTIDTFTPTPSQLNPAPIAYTNSSVNVSTGSHISVQSTISLSLNEADIAEIISAVETLYGDASYATLSELATVTAIPKVVDSTLGGINITYEEAIAAQIANFIPANIDLKFTTKSIDHTYSLGHVAPYVR